MKICIVSDSHDRAEPVNPVPVSGIGTPNMGEVYSWILGDLASMDFEIHTLKYC